MDIYYVFVQNKEFRMPKLNQNVIHGLWVIMMYQCNLIKFNKHITLGMSIMGKAIGRNTGLCEISVPSSSQICSGPKTILKKLS